MRLLQRSAGGSFELHSFDDENPPPYAILSHTWIEGNEVTYGELVAGAGKDKTGYKKIQFCGRRAAADDLQYFWVDTCCIDKSVSHELSTAINSMFRWYERASRCYVYLSDVAVPEEIANAEAFPITWEAAFQQSRWFTRGWTLQELLAPPCVEFFSKEGRRLGSRISLERQIHKITSIPVEVLRGQSLAERGVEERMSWAGRRTTTLKEDRVYCLLGIFGVFLPLIYGEGEAYAMLRLREEIHKRQGGLTESEALFMVPFARDGLFVGREDILAKIDELAAAAPTHARIALAGLGGVGKSQVAIEYAYRAREAQPHMVVIWIHASDPTRFWQGYRDIADKLMLPGRDDAKADLLPLVHAWLSDRQNGQWLMILDNVDDDGIFFSNDPDGKPLESFLPQAAHGTILITSRNNMAATNLVGGHGDVVEVEPMGEDEAMALLHTRVPFEESSRADARALVHVLEYIPLAIMHAAAYVKTRASTTTISTYLELFRESEANQVHLLSRKEWKDIRRDHSIRHAVIATWQISFKHIQTTERPAADLLALMSMYDKQGIPRWLVQGNASQLDFGDALAPLLSFSLVKTELGGLALTMHRLVQLSMRKWLEAESELGRWVKESIEALSAAFPSGDYGTWEQCKVLLPHVEEVLGYRTEDREGMEKQAESASRAGWYLLLSGEFAAAEGFMRKSLEIREKALGREDPHTLISVSQLGLLLERQGHQLGSVLVRQGQYEEAEAMHRRALEGREKVLGREHPYTLTSVSQLGLVLARQGQYKEADAINQRALEGREKVLGREHADTLTSINNIGLVLKRQGQYKEAEAMHRQALEGYKKVLGREHPYTLTSVSNLGLVLERQGKYKEAEAMHQRALEGYEKVLGREHPYTLTSVSNLRLVLGREHPDTLTSVYNLASLFHRQRQYSPAVELYQRAYNGRVKVLGAQHPRTVACLRHYRSALEHREL
ncbi:kinesin light chain 1 [Phaeosphaeria sp. MPI-PUGE-AT-0046c]|nr:kinesin light chain 1 [Phaeosphaeria sp. MPI-PUGE-AT-0046c]